MDLSEASVDIVAEADEACFRALMQAHHCLGALQPVGETVRYVARHRDRWLAIAVLSAPALKYGARDRRVGWHCSRIRAGHEPENTTLLRRFAIGVIKTRGSPSRRRCAGWAGTCGACSTS